MAHTSRGNLQSRLDKLEEPVGWARREVGMGNSLDDAADDTGRNLDQVLKQFGVEISQRAAKTGVVLKALVECVRAGDDAKTHHALSELYKSMDLAKVPGDPARFFVSSCEVLNSRKLLPTEFVPLGAVRGSPKGGSEYGVFTAIGVGLPSGSHLFSSETRFEVVQNDSPTEELIVQPLPKTAARALLGKIANTLVEEEATGADTLVVSDHAWSVTFWLSPDRVPATRRLATKLAQEAVS
jgi:hypothetical protein